jgi:hypothetical protein
MLRVSGHLNGFAVLNLHQKSAGVGTVIRAY